MSRITRAAGAVADRLEARLAVAGLVDAEALAAQVEVDQVGDVRVVLDRRRWPAWHRPSPGRTVRPRAAVRTERSGRRPYDRPRDALRGARACRATRHGGRDPAGLRRPGPPAPPRLPHRRRRPRPGRGRASRCEQSTRRGRVLSDPELRRRYDAAETAPRRRPAAARNATRAAGGPTPTTATTETRPTPARRRRRSTLVDSRGRRPDASCRWRCSLAGDGRVLLLVSAWSPQLPGLLACRGHAAWCSPACCSSSCRS